MSEINFICNDHEFLKKEFDKADSIDLSHLFDSYRRLIEFSSEYSNYDVDNSFNIAEERYVDFFPIFTQKIAWLSAIVIYFYILNNYKKISVLINCEYFSKKFCQTQELYFPFIPEINEDMSFFELSYAIRDKLEKVKYKFQSFLLEEYSYSHKGHENWFDIIAYISTKKEKKIEGSSILSNNKSPYIELFTTLNINSMLKKYIRKHIKNILLMGLNTPHIKIKNMSLLTRYERKKIIFDWNKTEKNSFFIENHTIPELIERNANVSPYATAIDWGIHKISYQDFVSKVSELSLVLIKNGMKKNDGVLLLQDRSINMLLTIIAILKCEGYYVPVDINFPAKRIQFILEDSKAKFIITTKDFKERPSVDGLPYEEIDFFENLQLIKTKYSSNLNLEKVAYLIYTSGSTGSPKGTLVSHRNVINYSCWFMDQFKFNNSSIIDFSSSISFDLSVSCTLMPLIAGGKIIIISEETKLDMLNYLDWLREKEITHVEWTPDYFYHLLQFPNEIKKVKSLKWIMLGGDAIVKKDVETCFTLLPDVNIVNEYGPTECTVAITSYITNAKNSNDYDKLIPIGKPAINTQAYILDKCMNPCPIGIPGELYISGKSVCLGYLNKKNTEEKFVINPFSKIYNKMYKTGDIVRWLPDANLDFLGREDDQVKVRGFRVELKEIEISLLQHPEIKQCKIILRKLNNNQILVAYLVLEKLSHLSGKELRRFLKKLVPDYMLPGQFIILENFPTSTTGKINVKALEKINSQQSPDFKQETFNTQMGLIKSIWCNAFGIGRIDEDDDFFDLGGHSLTALNIITQIHAKLGIRLNIKSIFLNSNVKELSNYINLSKKEANVKLIDNKIPQVICLGSKSTSDPIFFIHPVGGGIFIFHLLAQYINDSYSVYGLQDPGVEDPSVRFNSLQEMASYYVQAIQSCQPHGAYKVAGSSFGASLTIEIVRQLIFMGEEVSFTGLFDGWAKYPSAFKNREFFNNFMLPRVKDFVPDYAAKLLEMQYSREKLLHKYKIPQIESKLTLFKSEEVWPIFQKIDTEDNGWSKYCTQSVDLHIVPGDHESIFFTENVAVLARILKKCLVN